MLSTQKPFDWRAFWADLLGSTGRALLTLDNSDEARAAMVGLDYFDAAQHRRAEAAEDQSNGPSAGSDALGTYVNLNMPFSDFRGDGYAHTSESDFLPSSAMQSYLGHLSTGGMRLPSRPDAPGLRMRPAPLSANPYDLTELPAEVNFRTGRIPVTRRR
jgi:hypothetical protein